MIVTLVTGLGALLVLLTRPRHRSLFWAITGAFLLVVLVPSHSPPRDVAVLAILLSTALLVLALLRNVEQLRNCRPPVPLLLFLVYSVSVWIRDGFTNTVMLNVATNVMLILVALAISVGSSFSHRAFVYALVVAGVIQFALSLSEQFFGAEALWPRPDGTDVIESRVNILAPDLIGRAMGSTSQPIPLGILSGMAVIASLWLAIRGRNKIFFVPAGLALVTLVFSGTRSAVVATGVALLLWAALTARVARSVQYIYFGVGAMATVIIIDIEELLGFGNFRQSESFTHRTGVFESATSLLSRAPGDVLWGSGYDSISGILRSGFAGDSSSIVVFDQEIVRTAASAGILGVMLLLAAVVSGLRRGDTLSRVFLSYSFFSFLAFDSLSWTLTTFLFVASAAGPAWNDPRGKSLGDAPRLKAKGALPVSHLVNNDLRTAEKHD